MQTLKIQHKKYSYADYLSWSGDERWELINGYPYAMAAPNRKHQEISGNIFAALHTFFKNKKCKIYAAPFDVRLSEQDVDDDENVHTVVQPDISVFCNPKNLDKRGAKGPPELAIEILSATTAMRDLNIKLLLYQKFKVKEYWIVDPDNEKVNVYWLDKNNRYEALGEYTPNSVILSALFPDLKLGTKTIFA